MRKAHTPSHRLTERSDGILSHQMPRNKILLSIFVVIKEKHLQRAVQCVLLRCLSETNRIVPIAVAKLCSGTPVNQSGESEMIAFNQDESCLL